MQVQKDTDWLAIFGFPSHPYLFLWWWLKCDMHLLLLLFSLLGGWKRPPPLLSVYERVARWSTGKVITLLFSLSTITGSVKPKRQADRAMTGPLIWQLLHITKQRAPITSKWRERGTSGERLTPLLCSAIFPGIFITPLTCCAPGAFRGSIQVAKEEAWVEGLPSGWLVSVGNLPGGWVCETLRVHDRLFTSLCVYVLKLRTEGCFQREVQVRWQPSFLWG